ncbi:PAS domain-containing sensor histidine kinase [Lentisphaera profundi]|uniref:histidine kinase n=1 Tax=Lentisphaera profundi TaxID=1658616 RepID=A0ABY7VWL5_9BACT|nr:PAS domain-containing sensor histidine kinase [Lentisphaera profundi]WDE97119.1 PAS domain-containing sensor histidine kinase [Lentisphaera profundi]
MAFNDTVLAWSTKRLFAFCFCLAFVYFFYTQSSKNKQVPDYNELIMSDASSLIFENQIILKPLASDELIKELATKHDAFVYIVNIHGLMLYASTPSSHQFNDLEILDKLVFKPELTIYQNVDYNSGKNFLRFYLPYATPELPTETTFLIIDKTFYTTNPYISALKPALFYALLASSLLSLIFSLFIARPIGQQINSIKLAFGQQNDEHRPNYKGIPELMKIRQTQDSLHRKNTQRQLKQSTEIQYWESFFNAIPTGLIIVNQDNSIINANQESFNLFKTPSIAQPKGTFIMAAYKNSDLSRLSNDFIASGQEFNETEIQVFRQGDERKLNMKLVRIPLRNGKGHGLIIVINDITRIRQLENTRKEFVSNVSHELKTPITVTLGFLETLEDCLDDPEQAQYFLKIIKRNTHRLDNIIQDLLTLSRLETQEKEQVIGYEKKDILKSLNSTIDLVSEELKSNHVKLECQIYSHDLKLNHGLIELAVRNLLENAIRYSDPDNAVIKLNMSHTDQNLTIKISDNGPGIPSQFHERIFQRFFRVDESRDRNTGGSGLGLSIVKHIIQLHNGSINIDSNVGQGSCFILVIPK